MLLPDDVEAKDYKRLSQMLPAIKGIAILMVVIYHVWGYSKGWARFSEISWGNNLKNLSEGLFNLICLMGEHGVHFFLIASGFGLGASWWRQYTRIFPLYWLAHGFALILALVNSTWAPQGQELLQGNPRAIAALLLSLTTLRNFFLEYYFFLNPAWWYIGLAVQLYLIFPLLVWVGKRWGWSTLLAGSLSLSLIYRAIIVALPLKGQAVDVLIRGAFFPSRLFEFTFGIVLAISLLSQQYPQMKHSLGSLSSWLKTLLFEFRCIGLNAIIWAVGLACHWASSEGWLMLRIPADALIGVGEFCFVFQILNLIPWRQSWLNPLGEYSYGIYLTHMNVLRALLTIFVPVVSSYWVRFGVVIAITCFLGGCFEFGYNWLQQRFEKKKLTSYPKK